MTKMYALLVVESQSNYICAEICIDLNLNQDTNFNIYASSFR